MICEWGRWGGNVMGMEHMLEVGEGIVRPQKIGKANEEERE